MAVFGIALRSRIIRALRASISIGAFGRCVAGLFASRVRRRARAGSGCLAAGRHVWHVARLTTFARDVINFHTRFYVVYKYVEANGLPAIFNRFRFHLHAACHEVVRGKNGRHAIKHVVARLLHVIGHDVFVISHANRIHGARARDEVFLVGVFSAKLMRD